MKRVLDFHEVPIPQDGAPSPSRNLSIVVKEFPIMAQQALTFRHGGRDMRLTDVHGHVLHKILA